MFIQENYINTLGELTALMTEQFDMLLNEGGLDEYREFFKTFMKEKYGTDSLAGMSPDKRKQLFKDAGAEWQRRKAAKAKGGETTPVKESTSFEDKYNSNMATVRNYEKQKSEESFGEACKILKEQSDELYSKDHRYRSIYGQYLKEFKIVDPEELYVVDKKKFYTFALGRYNKEFHQRVTY